MGSLCSPAGPRFRRGARQDGLAIWMSCTATPVRSAIVICPSAVRPGAGRDDGAELDHPAGIEPRPPRAWWISPRTKHWARLSATTTSARARRSGASSVFSGVSEPMAVMCVPGRTCTGGQSGVCEAVVVTMRFARRRHRRRALAALRARSPNEPDRRRTLALAGSRAQTITSRHGVISFRYSACSRACTPDPQNADRPHFARREMLAATAPAAAVRTFVM